MTMSNLKILIVCLIVVYLFQFYNGYTLLKLWLWSPYIECDFIQVLLLCTMLLQCVWLHNYLPSQIPLLSLLFFVVACMNASTLSTFVIGKRKKSSPSEKHKSF